MSERIRYVNYTDVIVTVFSIDLSTADVNGMTQINTGFNQLTLVIYILFYIIYITKSL